MACHLAAACVPRLAVVASSAARESVRRIRRRPPGSPQQAPSAAPTQPSVAEVRRAIGAADDPSATGKEKQSAFMELLASTPIGQPESDAERRIREAAEWVVDNTEARAQEGQKSILVLCMKIFPLWLFLMLIALGVIKLPFDIPGLDMDNLLTLTSWFTETLVLVKQTRIILYAKGPDELDEIFEMVAMQLA